MFDWLKKHDKKSDSDKHNPGPDFTDVDKMKAEKMLLQGQLERLHFIPIEFGGQDIPPNIVYVPRGAIIHSTSSGEQLKPRSASSRESA